MIHLNQPPNQKPGQGTGGSGRGRGGQLPESDSNVAFKTERIKGKPSGKGKITASIYVKGRGEKGDATVAYKNAVEALEKAAEDALDDSDIPLERRSLVRDYFNHIRPGDAEAGAEKKK